MANIKVKCPYCQAELETDAVLAGSEVECAACGKRFFVKAPVSPIPPAYVNRVPQYDANSSSSGTAKSIIFGLLLALSLLLSCASLCWIYFMPKMPQMKFQKDPEKAVRSYIAMRVELNSIKRYFWQKNGKKIQESLEIKEVRESGSYACVFYKLSHGATEVKEVMYLHRNADDYWIQCDRYKVEKDLPTFYQEMHEKEIHFTKDSGKFKDDDI